MMRNHRKVAIALVVASLTVISGAQAEQPKESAEIIQIPNAKLFGGTILVGGQPSRENLEQAAAAGYGTVVNLRSPGEFSDWDEADLAESLGLRYVSIPVGGASGLTLENAKRLAAELDRSNGNPIILHCASGNRVGALLALKAFHVDGLDAPSALQLGLDNGLKSLEAVVRDHLRTKRDP